MPSKKGELANMVQPIKKKIDDVRWQGQRMLEAGDAKFGSSTDDSLLTIY